MPIFKEYRTQQGIERFAELASSGDVSSQKTDSSSGGEMNQQKVNQVKNLNYSLPSMNSAGKGMIVNKTK